MFPLIKIVYIDKNLHKVHSVLKQNTFKLIILLTIIYYRDLIAVTPLVILSSIENVFVQIDVRYIKTNNVL